VVILPFFFSNPSQFFYDVFEFQFLRSAQQDGSFSLYNILSTNLGIQLSIYIRAILFIVPFMLSAFWSMRKPNLLLVSSGIMLFLAAFILPINGFWNYFIPPLAILCAFIPTAITFVTQKIKPPS